MNIPCAHTPGLLEGSWDGDAGDISGMTEIVGGGEQGWPIQMSLRGKLMISRKYPGYPGSTPSSPAYHSLVALGKLSNSL